MSHIPAAAMPHAQTHETPTTAPKVAPPIKREPLPWNALVAGGVLAIGGAVTAAWLLRGRGKAPASARRNGARKGTTKTATKRNSSNRKARAKTAAADA